MCYGMFLKQNCAWQWTLILHMGLVSRIGFAVWLERGGLFANEGEYPYQSVGGLRLRGCRDCECSFLVSPWDLSDSAYTQPSDTWIQWPIGRSIDQVSDSRQFVKGLCVVTYTPFKDGFSRLLLELKYALELPPHQ